MQVPCGSKNDHIVQVVTYTYAPFSMVLNIPRDVAPPPMAQFEVF